MPYRQPHAPITLLWYFSTGWVPRTLLLLSTLLLAGCVDATWNGDASGPTPLAWQRHPLTAGWTHPHIYYEFDSNGVLAYVRPWGFFLPFHSERAERIGPHRGRPGNYIYDMTFHGVTDHYWAHFAGPEHEATLTVVAPNAQPDPAYNPKPSY